MLAVRGVSSLNKMGAGGGSLEYFTSTLETRGRARYLESKIRITGPSRRSFPDVGCTLSFCVRIDNRLGRYRRHTHGTQVLSFCLSRLVVRVSRRDRDVMRRSELGVAGAFAATAGPTAVRGAAARRAWWTAHRSSSRCSSRRSS